MSMTYPTAVSLLTFPMWITIGQYSDQYLEIFLQIISPLLRFILYGENFARKMSKMFDARDSTSTTGTGKSTTLNQ